MHHHRYFTVAVVNLLLFCCPVFSKGQTQEKFVRNTFYLEGASRGALYSINYDRVFHKGAKISTSYRAGLSVLKDAIAAPIGINFFTGQNASHLELGLTLVPYIEKYNYLFSGKNESDKQLYIIPAIGYRYQKATRGFFFKANVSPMVFLDPASDDFWRMDGKLYPGITAGAGYSF